MISLAVGRSLQLVELIEHSVIAGKVAAVVICAGNSVKAELMGLSADFYGECVLTGYNAANGDSGLGLGLVESEAALVLSDGDRGVTAYLELCISVGIKLRLEVPLAAVCVNRASGAAVLSAGVAEALLKFGVQRGNYVLFKVVRACNVSVGVKRGVNVKFNGLLYAADLDIQRHAELLGLAAVIGCGYLPAGGSNSLVKVKVEIAHFKGAALCLCRRCEL